MICKAKINCTLAVRYSIITLQIEQRDKIMRVTVFHKEDQAFNRMCVVEAPSNNIEDALEYAYRWTNNINGSWSRDDIKNNADWNENVTEIAPLEDGYGHRSSMMQDRFLTEDGWYEVAGFGFKKLDMHKVAQLQNDAEWERGIEAGMKEAV